MIDIFLRVHAGKKDVNGIVAVSDSRDELGRGVSPGCRSSVVGRRSSVERLPLGPGLDARYVVPAWAISLEQ
jgi:hypothetical protein